METDKNKIETNDPVYEAYDILVTALEKDDLTFEEATEAMQSAVGFLGEALE